MSRRYDSLDITKFVLSLMVVAIHVNPLGETAGYFRFPFTRIAVPVFFLISAFLLFEKVDAMKDALQKRQSIRKFVKRNLQLYLAWFVVLLSLTIYVRGYFRTGIADTLKELVISFLFGSTFQASWYIMALVIGTLIVWSVSRFPGNGWAITLGMFCYAICCLLSSYANALGEDNVLIWIKDQYPNEIYNSFPVAIIWISLGKWMAEHKKTIEKISVGKTGLCLCISAAALLAEHCWVRAMHWQDANDCYFMLIPTCVAAFILVLNIKVESPVVEKLRRFSTVTYCMHVGVKQIAGAMMKSLLGLDPSTFTGGIMLYLLVLFCCAVATLLISRLRKKPMFSFLRYLV